MFTNPTHECSAAQFCLVAQLCLLFWDSLVIEHGVLLTQDETSVAFRNPHGSVTAHHKCAFNGQEMAVLQEERNGKEDVCDKVGSSGGNREKADAVSSLPKVSSVSGDDTAPC